MALKAVALALMLLTALIAPHSMAAPKSELWSYWSAYQSQSSVKVDHQIWQALLSRYVLLSEDGIHRVAYGEFDEKAKAKLREYLDAMARIAPTQLNRDEQLAYWINLYNAQTIQVVLDHPRKKSILSMGPFFSLGPWDESYLTIENKPITLNDIEHRILRPIWQDHRLHYVLNCASIGCPNLSQTAYRATSIAQQMADAQIAFLQHPRAISFTDRGELQLTSLFDWYLADFAPDVFGLLAYLAVQRPDLAADLAAMAGNADAKINYVYDWDLNVVD